MKFNDRVLKITFTTFKTWEQEDDTIRVGPESKTNNISTHSEGGADGKLDSFFLEFCISSFLRN